MHKVLAEAQHASLVSQVTEEGPPLPVSAAHSPSPSLDSSASADQSDSEAEDMPLNRRPAAFQPTKATAAVQRERRRRQILPKIAKEDRCGYCHHCLNPKLKKACITARKQQMKSLDDKEELPLFYKIADNKLDSKALPPVRAKPAPTSQQVEVNDQLQRLLTTVDGQVMIKPGKQHHFIDLMHRPQMKWAVRIFFLTTITALPTSDKALLVNMAECKGLTILHSWLTLAAERTSDAEKFTLDVLKTLGVLPVDMTALKKVPVGKTVNNLSKKSPSQKVRAAAAKVVLQWRSNVGMVSKGNATKHLKIV